MYNKYLYKIQQLLYLFIIIKKKFSMNTLNKEKNDYLHKIYFDPSHPASFEGPLRLYKAVKKDKIYNISHSEIKRWIQNKESYSKNKGVNRQFQRSRVIVSGIDDQWDIDLASFISFSDENDNYKYLVCVIDIFSRYAWIIPIKDKKAENIVQAFNIVLAEGRKPRRLRSDAATDFTSKKFQRNLNDKGITHFTTHNEKQANFVERFIQTIKSKIFRYMIERNDARYIDILPKLVDSYNKTWHSGIRSEPINVNQTNEKQLWWQMYWPKYKYVHKKKRKKIKYKFNISDTVRIAYTISAFSREYGMKWSTEIFKIIRRYNRLGLPIYKLNDWSDDPVAGTFYESELQSVNVTDDMFKIENIIRYKGRGKNKQALVNWKGWPKKFDSWVLVSDIKSI